MLQDCGRGWWSSEKQMAAVCDTALALISEIWERNTEQRREDGRAPAVV